MSLTVNLSNITNNNPKPLLIMTRCGLLFKLNSSVNCNERVNDIVWRGKVTCENLTVITKVVKITKIRLYML